MKIVAFHHYEHSLARRLGSVLPEKSDCVLVLHDLLLERVSRSVHPEQMICFLPDVFPSRKNTEEYVARRDLLRRAKAVATCSNFSRKLIEEWLDREVSVVRYVPVEVLSGNVVSRVSCQIIFIGRVVPHKRLDLFLNACGNIERSVQVVLATRMSSVPDADAEKEKARMLCASRVGVVPSDFEGFSIVPGEMALCGVVPVLSDIPTHQEVYPEFPMFHSNDVNACRKMIEKAMDGEFDASIDFRREFVQREYGLIPTVHRIAAYVRSVLDCT